MARRFGKFNPRQKRDSHGRWTKGASAVGSKARSGAKRAGSGAKKAAKYLFVPKRPVNRSNGKQLSNKQIALRVGIALAPIVLPGLGAGFGKLDTFVQTATHNKFVRNAAASQANYDRMKRAATIGLKVGQSSLRYAKARKGVYNISSYK